MVPIRQGLKRTHKSPSKTPSKSPSSSQENSPADGQNKWVQKRWQFKADQLARSLARAQNPNYDAEQAAQKVAKEAEDLAKLFELMNTK